MPSPVIATPGQLELRSRASHRLGAPTGTQGLPASASAALGVLHQLASSPATAADALALLHELQVHQVELELQAEELRDSRADLELDLQRRIQLWDHAPASCLTIGRQTELRELNLAAAEALGASRAQLLGQPLDRFLTPASARVLHQMLDRVGAGRPAEAATLQLQTPGVGHEGVVAVQANVIADPVDLAGQQFLVAFVRIVQPDPAHIS
jgi:PAS domain-containing protein